MSSNVTLILSSGSGLGSNNAIYSSDLAAWSTGTLPQNPNTSGKSWTASTFAPQLGGTGRFVAVSASNSTAYSDDGAANWTEVVPPVANALRDICWAAEIGTLLAVGDGGTLLTSHDGEAWTVRSPPVGTGAANFQGCTWARGLGLFIVVSRDSTGVIITSPDGINWTQRTNPLAAGAGPLNSVAWSNSKGRAVITGEINKHVLISSDAVTWVDHDASAGLNHSVWARIRSVDSTANNYGANLGVTAPLSGYFLMVGGNFGNVAVSQDGLNWISRTNAAGIGKKVRDCIWDDNNKVWLASDDATVGKSQDGINWSAVTGIPGNVYNGFGVGFSSPPYEGPSYVNSGTPDHQAIGTTLSPGLPPSIAVDNLLVMIGYVNYGDNDWVDPAGWTVLTDIPPKAGAGYSARVWYRVADGTETGPTISWAAAASGNAVILQYTGALAAKMFGTPKLTAGNSATASMSALGLATARNNSLALTFAVYGNFSPSGDPSPGWTSDYVAPENIAVAEQDMPVYGTTTGYTQALSGAAYWSIASIELFSVEGGAEVGSTSIHIPAGKTATDLTDFPLLIDLSSLPAEFTATLNTNAGNLRAFFAGAGLPLDVIKWDGASGFAFVKVPTIFSSADTTVTLKTYDGEAAVPETHQVGRNAVWGDYEVVVFGENSLWIDHTGKHAPSVNGSNIAPVSQSALFAGTAVSVYNPASDVSASSLVYNFAAALPAFTWGMSVMMRRTGASNYPLGSVFANSAASQRMTAAYRGSVSGMNVWDQTNSWMPAPVPAFSPVANTTKFRAHVTYSGAAGTRRQMYNGPDGNVSSIAYASHPAAENLIIGRNEVSGTEYGNADIGFIYVRPGVLSDDWLRAEVASLTDPAAFYALGAGSDAAVPARATQTYVEVLRTDEDFIVDPPSFGVAVTQTYVEVLTRDFVLRTRKINRRVITATAGF